MQRAVEAEPRDLRLDRLAKRAIADEQRLDVGHLLAHDGDGADERERVLRRYELRDLHHQRRGAPHAE